MALWVAVHGLADGDLVNAETYNKPIYELAERTNYLYSRLQELAGSGLYESVRLYNVPLTTTGDLAPAIKDVVCLDNTTGTFVKAQASMSLLDEFVAANSAFALGILISKTGSVGTVLVQGRLTLATNNVPWALADLLETGETFRNGQYYLSSLEAGKLTATPSGPMIYVGYFLCDADAVEYGDYAVLNPQYHDTGESHVHRTFKLYSQPAGQQVVTEESPDGIHYVTGFPSISVKAGDIDEGDRIPRLNILGEWTHTEAIQYTIWLSTSMGTIQGTSIAPIDWSDTYLHWISSDPEEGQGKVQVWSFESVVTIGTHGLQAVLENPSGNSPFEGTDWDIPYNVTTDTVNKRSWSILAPTMTAGWRARYWRQYFDDHPATDYNFSVMLIGGPHSQSDNRMADTITVKCAEIHQFDLELPSDGDTTQIDTYVFEYTDDGTVTPYSDNIPVLLTADVAETYTNLLNAILALDDATITPVMDADALSMMIGTAAGITVTHRTVPVTVAAAGAGNITAGAPTAAFLVYDQYNQSLITDYGTLYWNNAELWQFASLKNGMQILLIPYDSDGTPASGDAVAIGDYWSSEIVDLAPGAHFVYAMGMHQGLSAYYPPVPAKVAALVLNGVELDSDAYFPGSASYAMAPDSIHWYSDQYGTVPWPLDWVDTEDVGSAHLAQKMLFHFVRNAIGDSGYVTSVRPAPNSPIKVFKCGTIDAATTGDLALDLDLNLTTEDANLSGYKVVKSATGGKLQRGPVVERIIPGPGLAVTQTSGAPSGQGVVTISLTSGDNVYTGDFEEVALENAKQELIGMFPYIRLLGWTTGGTNTPTGFVAKFRVPHTAVVGYYRVIVYATVFGETDIPFVADSTEPRAGLTFTYSILPDVYPIGETTEWPTDNLIDNLIEPAEVLSVAVPFGDRTKNPIYHSYDPMLIHNNPDEANVTGHVLQVLGLPFPNIDDIPDWPDDPAQLGVRPGSLVGIRISRADLNDPTNEYTGALGFINLRWTLVAVA